MNCRAADAPQVIWFGILFRVRTLDGIRTGYVEAYGPDPVGNEHFQQARREVLDRAVVRLGQAIVSALSKRS